MADAPAPMMIAAVHWRAPKPRKAGSAPTSQGSVATVSTRCWAKTTVTGGRLSASPRRNSASVPHSAAASATVSMPGIWSRDITDGG